LLVSTTGELARCSTARRAVPKVARLPTAGEDANLGGHPIPGGEMSGKDIRESVGLLLVVASLVFVGMEIRQSTAVARAQSRQFLTENHREWAYTLATNPELSDLFNDTWDPDDARTTEQRQASYLMFALMRHLENVFLQVNEGVIDESVFESYAWTDLTYFQSESFDAWWAANSSRFNESFRDAFENEYGLVPQP